MVIIFQTGDTTYADSDPTFSPYDNELFGSIWINKTTKKQYLGTETGWESIDTADGMTVSRSGLTLTSADGSALTITNDSGVLSINNTPIVINPPSGSLTEMLAISSPQLGQQFYLLLGDSTTFSYNKLCVWSGRTWQVQGETIEMCSDGDLPLNYIVEPDDTTDFTVKKCEISQDKDFVGVIQFQGSTSTSDWVTVAYSGVWAVAVEANTHERNDFILSDSIDGLGKTSSSATTGVFGKVIQDKTTTSDGETVLAILHTVERF